MKQLDFPISAAAVHLHGREFHEQDFFVPAAATSEHIDLSVADDAASPDGSDSTAYNHSPGYGGQPSLGERAKKLARWTLACLGLALAAVVVMSWLVRPDTRQVQWVDSAVPATASRAD